MAVDRQEEREDTVLKAYRQFIKWRQSLPTMKVGDLALIETDNKVIAFMREKDNEKVLCVFNTSEEPCEWTYTGDVQKPYDDINNGLKAEGNKFSFAPYGYGFFKVS